MSTALEKVAARNVRRTLAGQAISKDKPVAVLVDKDMTEIARRIRAKAKARGMTDEAFEALTNDL